MAKSPLPFPEEAAKRLKYVAENVLRPSEFGEAGLAADIRTLLIFSMEADALLSLSGADE